MIRIAVIGAGHWGPNLIRNFDNKQTSEVAWVVDRDAERLRQVVERFPGVRPSADPGDAIGDPGVDAVVIATPTATHHAICEAALRGGKHVFVEKPITANAEQAEQLCQMADEGKLILMVGHVFLYNAAVQHVKRQIDQGSLGPIYYISMVRTNLGPIRMDVNAAWDLAAHDISIANYWIGVQPLSACAVGGSWINRGIEDTVFATLKFPGEVLVNLHASWLNPRKAREITVVGERRMLTFDDMNLAEPIRVYDKYVSDNRVQSQVVDSFASFRASIREGDITIPKVALGEPLRTECEHFLDCIGTGTTPMTDGLEATRVVRVLEAIAQSAANAGREEPVGP